MSEEKLQQDLIDLGLAYGRWCSLSHKRVRFGQYVINTTDLVVKPVNPPDEPGLRSNPDIFYEKDPLTAFNKIAEHIKNKYCANNEPLE